MRKVVTVGEMGISDHKPKKLMLMLEKKKVEECISGEKNPSDQVGRAKK